MKEIEIGSQVTYRNASGKERTGIVHAIKKVDREKGGTVVHSYLVDTGKDVRVDEVHTDVRDIEFGKRVTGILEDKKNPINEFQDAVAEVDTHTDLPDSDPQVEYIRQPVQVEVMPGDILAVK